MRGGLTHSAEGRILPWSQFLRLGGSWVDIVLTQGASRTLRPVSPLWGDLLSTPLSGRLFWGLSTLMNGRYWIVMDHQEIVVVIDN